MTLKFDHYGIKAAEVARSMDFYIRVLGFRHLETVVVGGRDFIFVGDDRVRIEIEPALPGSHPPDNNLGIGIMHMAFLVDDLEAEAARLKGLGVKFVLGPAQFRSDRKIAFIEDPDGCRIQFIQMLK